MAEPILDVVRGLSTLASFGIVVNQLKNIYDAFFLSECNRCRGTGIVTCPHCHGTKTLRRRPGYLRTRDFGIVDDARDSYMCIYCGPALTYDSNPFADDNEMKAMEVQENMKAAMANLFPRPFQSEPTAGTVSCPTCLGSPRVRRITPDFGKALALDPTWDMQVAARTGRWFWGRDARPADRKRLYLEYPSAPVKSPIELPSPRPSLPAAEKKEEEMEVDVVEYVIRYASDDDN